MSLILENMRFEGPYTGKDFDTFQGSPGLYVVVCGETIHKCFFLEVGQSDSLNRHFREIVKPEWWWKECNKEEYLHGKTLEDVVGVYIHYNTEMTDQERQDFVDRTHKIYGAPFKTNC